MTSSVERIDQQIDLLTANASRIEDERPALLEAILVGGTELAGSSASPRITSFCPLSVQAWTTSSTT